MSRTLRLAARAAAPDRRVGRPVHVTHVIRGPVGRIEAGDGVELWVERTGDGQGVPLVLCHGGPGLWDNLGRLAALIDHERPVVRWDQRGCGRSGGADGLFSMTQSLADLQAVRRHLASRAGSSEATRGERRLLFAPSSPIRHAPPDSSTCPGPDSVAAGTPPTRRPPPRGSHQNSWRDVRSSRHSRAGRGRRRSSGERCGGRPTSPIDVEPSNSRPSMPVRRGRSTWLATLRSTQSSRPATPSHCSLVGDPWTYPLSSSTVLRTLDPPSPSTTWPRPCPTQMCASSRRPVTHPWLERPGAVAAVLRPWLANRS